MDEVLKKNGIDRATIFGGTIEGNDACKLMENCDAIIDKMEDYVLQAPTRIAGMDGKNWHVGETYQHLLYSLDGYLSSLQIKWFHLAAKILDKARQYHNQVLALEQYLG